MKSLWDDEEARRRVQAAGPDEADQQLALRVYTSQLIGVVPALVMHGGGNTSAKVERADRFGRLRPVLHVKGSGWDLGTIREPGLPGVWMEPLLDLRQLDSLSDEEMVAAQRAALLDASSPNPSVETLLHAFLPDRFIDHTHATVMMALADQPNVRELAQAIFGDRVAVVDYVMPGFELAKKAAEVYEAHPGVEGLLLAKHGHFTFGPDAKTAYERMIQHVSEVEGAIAAQPASEPAARTLPPLGADILPVLRGALAGPDGSLPVLDLRTGDDIDRFFGRDDLASLARRGVATPDHVIRTKRFPLLLDTGDLSAKGLATQVEAYRDEYRTTFERQKARTGRTLTMLDPSPRVLWVPGLGIAAAGKDAKAAAAAADLAVQTLEVMEAAERLGRFEPVGEDDTFDMEYWSLEQAKLGRAKPASLAGKVVLITGAAGAIGQAIAQAFAAQGAELFLVDRDKERLEEVASALKAASYVADLSEEGGAQATLAACVQALGGIDILVSNAGTAPTGRIGDVAESHLRESFEINLWAHQRMAQAALAVMRTQGQGGSLLFNVSKQAVNPGADFAPYGLAKAALMFLVKQYAVDHSGEGIRSGMLNPDMISRRANARGLSEADYMAGNLLGREVLASDVAQAFVALALAEATTGHIMTVDGGNIAASLR